MAYAIIDNSIIQNIANAIRAKLGIQTTMKPDEMPGKIASIPEIQGNAAVTNVLADKTFSSVTAGQGVTGTMPNRGAITKTLAPGETYTVPEGYHNGNGTVTTGGATQEKTATPDVTPVEVTPDEGYSLTKVTVAPIPNQRTVTDETIGVPKTYQAGWYPNQWTVTPEETEPTLQVKTVDPATTDQTVTADDGYDGLREVRVNAYTLTTKSITENGTYTASSDGANGYSSVTVNVPTGTAYPVRIYVATPPTKTEYNVGDILDLTGMVVKAVWSDDSETVITNNIATSPSNGDTLTIDDEIVNIFWTWQNSTAIYSTSQHLTITVLNVYGAEWAGGPDSSWVRTDMAEGFADPSPALNNGSGSSPFDNILPWSGMVVSENTAAGTVVSIPKYYYKWTQTGQKMKLQISASPFSGSSVSPAHADRGDGKGERDVVYVGRYNCDQFKKSESGYSASTSWTRSTWRSNIHSLGNNIWLYDFSMYWTIMMLYLVEFADWNTQEKIGYGGSIGTEKTCGGTDNMTYHTGTSGATRQTYGYTQYRGIEGLWDHAESHVDGIYVTNSNIYVMNNPSVYGTGSGTNIGSINNIDGYISKYIKPVASGYEYALFPCEANGSEDTYVCDYMSCSGASAANNSGIIVGGSAQSKLIGAFHLVLASNSQTSGARLMILP